MKENVHPTLTPTQIDTYRREGVLHVPGMFHSWVEHLRQGVAENLRNPSPFATINTIEGEQGFFFDDYCAWENIETYRNFVFHSGCANLAAQITGAKTIRFFHEHLVYKSVGTAKATPWHHDLPYYCIQGRQFLSVWIPLDPVPFKNSLRFVIGSHRDDQLYYPRKFIDGRNYDYDMGDYESIPDIDKYPETYPIRQWKMNPGDAVLFDFRSIHGTSAHPLIHDRRAIAFRWIGEDVVFFRRPGISSPPYPELESLRTGDELPEKLFPIIGQGNNQ